MVYNHTLVKSKFWLRSIMRLKVAGKKTGRHLIFALVVMLLGAIVCNASPISYNVSRTVGIASITGFMETDGTLGVLSAGNFVDWSLLLNDGTNTYNLYGPLSGNSSSVYVVGSDVTATTNQILFNFSGSDSGYLLFQYGVGIHDGFHYYCDNTTASICLAGETVAPAYYTQGQTVSRSGNVVIAGSAVPEPGSLLLFASGILGLSGILRRRLSN